tara:strand:+ start:19798 stop:20007 length:210 start_codon:yes stop_codon:yes gene_type:complete
MNRPRLPFVQSYFQSLQNRGVEIAEEVLVEYNELVETEGEFLAGRFIIEVYIETQKELEKNAKKEGYNG